MKQSGPKKSCPFLIVSAEYPVSLWKCLYLLLTAGLLFPVTVVQAHDARPVSVNIIETLPGYFQGKVTPPPTVEPGNIPQLVWPESCLPAANVPDAQLMQCEGGLFGKALRLDYPFFNPSLASFYRVSTLNGDEITAMLAPTDELWFVPAEVTFGNVAIQYLVLGMGHIIGGIDHLLFVLGLLVIARTTRRILWTITGFTLAHSITLSLSALGVLDIPVIPVEAVIALSIVLLAHEIGRRQQDSLTWRYPLLVSFGFGLLHGLGFASALGEIGLVRNEVLASLLFFNLGVEVGQIAFILVVITLVLGVGRLLTGAGLGGKVAPLLRQTELAAAYIIGIPASYWLIERVYQFL